MKLRQLEVFLAIVREGTATAAARALNTTQPNVTKTVRQLEGAFELPLFRRIGGRLQPTPEAEMLYDMAERIRDEVSEFERFALNLSRMQDGFLRIATQPSYSNSILPTAVARFQQRFPRVQLRIDVLGRESILKLDGQLPIDIAFVHYMGESPPSYVRETIAEQPMVCIMPDGHPLATQGRVSLRDVFGYVRIGFPPDHISSRLIEQSAPQDLRSSRPSITVNYTSLAADLVRQGIGVAVVDPIFSPGERYQGIVVKPLKERMVFKTGLATPSGKLISLPAREFIAIVTRLVTGAADPRRPRSRRRRVDRAGS